MINVRRTRCVRILLSIVICLIEDYCCLLKFRKLSNLLSPKRVVTSLKAVNPTHFFIRVTLTLNPSPRGRDLPSPSRALTAVFRARLEIFSLQRKQREFISGRFPMTNSVSIVRIAHLCRLGYFSAIASIGFPPSGRRTSGVFLEDADEMTRRQKAGSF